MTYFQELESMRRFLSGTPESIGLPAKRSLILVKRGHTGAIAQVTEVVPRPIIDLVNQSEVEKYRGLSGIQIEADDLSVRGVSREQFSYEDLLQTSIFVVDGAMNSSGSVDGGIEYARVSIREETSLTWELVLRRKGRK